MAEINVNFKIVEVNEDLGVVLLEYLADGATKERFGSQVGPVSLVLDCETVHTMTDEELKQEIAGRGLGIVQYQLNAIESENCGLNARLSSLLNQSIKISVNTEVSVHTV